MSDEIKYNVAPILQSNSNCCWLACYQMLFKWKGNRADEATKKIREAKIATDEGLDISQWITARNALGLSGYRVDYLKSFSKFLFEFDRHGPMWCAGSFLDGDPHVILIVGAREKGERLRYVDPFKLWKTGGEGTEYMSHDKWCGLIKNAPAATQMWP